MLKKLGVVLAFGVGGRDNAGMRGTVDAQLSMLSTLSTEDLIGSDHPIRRIRAVDVLQEPAAAFGPRDRGPVLRRGGGPSASGGRGRNLGADWRGARRRNHTHRSTTDPEARLFRKATGAAAMLCSISQQARKRVEEPFGRIKTIAGGRKLRHKGRQRNRAWYLIAAATYNLVRIARLDAPTT